VFLAVVTAFSALVLAEAWFSVNEGRFVSQAIRIGTAGEFDLQGFEWAAAGDKSVVEGEYYPAAPPGISVLASPITSVVWPVDDIPDWIEPIFVHAGEIHWKGSDWDDAGIPREMVSNVMYQTYLINITLALVMSVLLSWALFEFLAEVFPRSTGRQRVVAVLIMLLATNFTFFLGKCFTHTLSCTLIAWSIIALSRGGKACSDRGGRFYPYLAGLTAGLLPMLDYSLAPISVTLGVAALIRLSRWQGWLMFGLGVLGPLALFVAYHWTHFGGPLTLPHKFIDQGGGNASNHESGLYGIVIPSPKVAASILASPTYGLFSVAFILIPISIAALAMGIKKADRRFAMWMALVIAIVQFAVNASYPVDPHGGASWGPRYMFPAFLFLIIGAYCLLESRWRTPFLWVSGLAVVIQFSSQARGSKNGLLNHPLPWIDRLKMSFTEGFSTPLLSSAERAGMIDVSSWQVQVPLLAVTAGICFGFYQWWRRLG